MRKTPAMVTLATLLTGCGGHPFHAKYDAEGTYSYSEMLGSDGGCSDDFIAALQKGAEVTGAFPEYETNKTHDGTLTVAGTPIDIYIEAADVNNTAKGWPLDEEARLLFEDGTEWGLDYISFEAKQSCAPCKDGIIVHLFSTGQCEPWPVYDKDK